MTDDLASTYLYSQHLLRTIETHKYLLPERSACVCGYRLQRSRMVDAWHEHLEREMKGGLQ